MYTIRRHDAMISGFAFCKVAETNAYKVLQIEFVVSNMLKYR